MIDNKRTIKVTVSETYPEVQEPGLCMLGNNPNFAGMLIFCCPGCGQCGGIKIGEDKPDPSPSWKIVSGQAADPRTLTLSPSIHCIGCCGWHGYLKNGTFESC